MKKIFSFVLMLAATLSLNAKQYCQEEVIKGENKIYLTCEKLSEGNYQIVVEADVELTGLGGSFCEVNGVGGYQLNAPGHFVLSADKKKITCAIESTTDPRLYTPLYVLMPGEVNFGEFNDIEWGLCSQDVTEYTITLVQPATGGTISANVAKATYGTSIILTATPAEGKQLEAWDVKDAENNPISVNKENKFMMPASNVTVTATFKDKVDLTPATFYGKAEMEVATFNWSITRNADQTLTLAIEWDKDIEGAAPQVTVGSVQFAGMTASGKSASYTTSDTFEDGDKPTIFFYIAYTGAAARIDVDYTVGAENEKPDMTAIDTIKEGTRARKVVENGNIVILRDGVKFNILGSRL